MVKVILAALLMVCLTTNAFAWDSYKEFNHDLGHSSWATPVHLGLGYGAAALTIYYLPDKMNGYTKIALGLLAGVAAGCISESLDKNWDNKDLAQWSMGGAMGVAGMAIVYPLKFTF